jgi:hypothetical protein
VRGSRSIDAHGAGDPMSGVEQRLQRCWRKAYRIGGGVRYGKEAGGAWAGGFGST